MCNFSFYMRTDFSWLQAAVFNFKCMWDNRGGFVGEGHCLFLSWPEQLEEAGKFQTCKSFFRSDLGVFKQSHLECCSHDCCPYGRHVRCNCPLEHRFSWHHFTFGRGWPLRASLSVPLLTFTPQCATHSQKQRHMLLTYKPKLWCSRGNSRCS